MSLSGMTIARRGDSKTLPNADVEARLSALGASVVDDVDTDTDVFVRGGFGTTLSTKKKRKKDDTNRRKAGEYLPTQE